MGNEMARTQIKGKVYKLDFEVLSYLTRIEAENKKLLKALSESTSDNIKIANIGSKFRKALEVIKQTNLEGNSYGDEETTEKIYEIASDALKA